MTDEVRALRTLFEDYLKYTYWSERTLATLLPGMVKYVASKDIAQILLELSVNTQSHCSRIGQIFESIGLPPEEKKFDAMESLFREAELIVDQTRSGSVRDAAVIALVQHILHCEIASYGTLKSFAITLKEENVVTLLEENLQEEKYIDQKLSTVAQAYVNDEAANKEY